MPDLLHSRHRSPQWTSSSSDDPTYKPTCFHTHLPFSIACHFTKRDVRHTISNCTPHPCLGFLSCSCLRDLYLSMNLPPSKLLPLYWHLEISFLIFNLKTIFPQYYRPLGIYLALHSETSWESHLTHFFLHLPLHYSFSIWCLWAFNTMNHTTFFFLFFGSPI